MSEMFVDKLTGKTSAGDVEVLSEGGNTTMQLQQGLTKAWGDYNQVTDTILDSFNISTVGDFAAGRFDVVLASNMSTTAYSVVASSIGNNASYSNTCSDLDAKATDGLRMRVFHNSTHGTADLNNNSFSFNGDLA